jgi:hypothetical protein
MSGEILRKWRKEERRKLPGFSFQFKTAEKISKVKVIMKNDMRN